MPQAPLTESQKERWGEDLRPALITSLTIFLILNNVCVGSRLWVQWKTARRFFTDDVFIFLSGICVNVVCSCLLVATHFGLGLHTWRINAQDPMVTSNLSNLFIYVWIVMIFTGPTFTAIKLSLLFFYKRLFLVHQKWLRVAWWANLIYVVLWFFGTTLYFILQCSPPQWYYLHYYHDYQEPLPGKIKSGQCNAESVIHTSLPIILGLISDVAILCLPLVAISALQMNKKKKLAMVLLFAVGTLACTLELVRIISLRIGTDDKKDPTWGDTNFLILSAAEEVTALLCACLPVIGPQVVKDLRNFRKNYTQRNTSSRYQYQYRLSRPDGFKRFASDTHHEDTTALREGSDKSHSTEDVEMMPVERSVQSNLGRKKDTVLVRTDVEVTHEQDPGRGSKDPYALPPLDEPDGSPNGTWKIV